ncbi:hypothetical protein EJB05_16593, partial [Eragrostis curvula]
MDLSSTFSALLLVLLLPLLCFLYLSRDPRKKPRADGLKAYPLLGTLPHFIPGLSGGVITANPANVEHILKTNFANYPKGDLTVSTIEDFLGHGIFNSDGEQWLWQRKAASYEFNNRSLRSFVVDAVRFEVVERLLPLLERAASDGRTLDVEDVMERFAFDSICRVAFGEDPACLVTEEGMSASQSTEFLSAFNEVQNGILARFMSPVKSLWRLKKVLNLESERRLREALETVHGYADRIVRERKERGAAGLACRDDFLSRFAASGEHSDESLRDVVTNFLLAGRDTTPSALTWFFWLVSGRPDVEDKILREIRAVRASSSVQQGSTGRATFSFDELRDMHYLHAAITESMRLYPPVPIDSQCCKQDDFLPDGTFVAKGWMTTYSAPFKYPVFHAGPRMCLGKEMAYIQMKSIAACVFETFSFKFVGRNEHPELMLKFTLRMKGGLPMQVYKRSK